jgi:hypothetical protein
LGDCIEPPCGNPEGVRAFYALLAALAFAAPIVAIRAFPHDTRLTAQV